MAITIAISALANGTYSVEDNGTPGDGVSVITDATNNIVSAFAHPGDALTVLARAGQDYDVEFTDSLVAAAFTVGSQTSAGVNPDSIAIGAVSTSGTVTLTARESISEL